ncbi:MAG: helix-turn-helix domain-containing protein [Leptospiraceae bacterium]|nr:helix-turn-helix domain-containing protein [Leptospiraceae bacterium]
MLENIYKLLASMKKSEEDWEEAFNSNFELLLRIVGANSGVVVLRERDGFVEKVRAGYEDDEFYYDFLVRGKGNFEKIEASTKPVLFRSESFNLGNQQSEFALASRVFSSRMEGFVIFEFQSNARLELSSWIIGLIAYRISELITNVSSETQSDSFSNKSNIGYDESTLWLLNLSENWEGVFLKALDRKRFTILSEEGSGQKKIIKSIFADRKISGELFFLNSIPSNLAKLEKSLSNWLEISKDGWLVFERPQEWSLSQQKLIYEILQKQQNYYSMIIFFVNRNWNTEERYYSLWKFIEEVVLEIPSIRTLEKQQLTEFVKLVCKEIGKENFRSRIQLSDSAMEKLLDFSKEYNYELLRQILEETIIGLQGTSIQMEDLTLDGYTKDFSEIHTSEDDVDLNKIKERIERQKILEASRLYSGNQVRMAKALHISRGSLQYKMKKFGLTK